MKKLFIAFLGFGLIACGGSETTEEHSDETVSTDTTVADTLVEEAELTAADLEYFEDYAQIKTKEQLYAIFGDENCVDDTSWYAEGTMMRMSTKIQNPESGWRLTYVYEENEAEKVSFIEAYYQLYDKDYNDLGTQKIETAEGLYTGMPLMDFEEWNEGPIEFSGFGWDYGGSVFGPEGAKFLDASVDMTLEMDPTKIFAEGFEDLLGDQTLTTEMDLVQRAPIVIYNLTLQVTD